MEKLEYKAISAKAVREDGTLYIEGYTSVFGNIDAYGDVVVKGASVKSIADFSRIKVLKQHDPSNIVGKVVDIREDETGIWFRAMISKAEEKLAVKIEEGLYDEMSIGYYTIERDFKNDIRYLNEIELVEISVVFRAANDKAKIISAERKDIMTDEQLAEELKSVYERKRDIEREMIKRAIKAAFQKA